MSSYDIKVELTLVQANLILNTLGVLLPLALYYFLPLLFRKLVGIKKNRDVFTMWNLSVSGPTSMIYTLCHKIGYKNRIFTTVSLLVLTFIFVINLIDNSVIYECWNKDLINGTIIAPVDVSLNFTGDGNGFRRLLHTLGSIDAQIPINSLGFAETNNPSRLWFTGNNVDISSEISGKCASVNGFFMETAMSCKEFYDKINPTNGCSLRGVIEELTTIDSDFYTFVEPNRTSACLNLDETETSSVLGDTIIKASSRQIFPGALSINQTTITKYESSDECNTDKCRDYFGFSDGKTTYNAYFFNKGFVNENITSICNCTGNIGYGIVGGCLGELEAIRVDYNNLPYEEFSDVYSHLQNSLVRYYPFNSRTGNIDKNASSVDYVSLLESTHNRNMFDLTRGERNYILTTVTKPSVCVPIYLVVSYLILILLLIVTMFSYFFIFEKIYLKQSFLDQHFLSNLKIVTGKGYESLGKWVNKESKLPYYG